MIYLVKTGLMGLVGQFRSVDHQMYQRAQHVICRTSRGLEQGEVICQVEQETQRSDGELLRQVSDNDQMILERIQRHRDKAFHACNRLIESRGLQATLVDVEHLFDGQSLFFYFLGKPDQALENLTLELAETYEAKVRFRKFAETLVNGCGPDCGTKEGAGCGSSCGSCALSGKCGSK